MILASRDWLVAIDYLGRIAVLECMAIDVYRGGSWRPLWVPALEALVDSGVDCNPIAAQVCLTNAS